jgi:hypothetical protein
MSSSMLARGLLSALALSFLVAPLAFADDPGTTTETTTTTTTTETTYTGTTTETATTTTTTGADAPPDPWAETPQTLRLRARAAHLRAVTRHWWALMRKPVPRVAPPLVGFASLLEQRSWWVQAWRRKAYWARWHGHRPPHLAGWLCIHRYEAAWRDPNAPYYGGLQMDLSFQSQYGASLLRRKGTANHWTRFEQMWVAERAHRAGRGFYPWPNTARYCGLI